MTDSASIDVLRIAVLLQHPAAAAVAIGLQCIAFVAYYIYIFIHHQMAATYTYTHTIHAFSSCRNLCGSVRFIISELLNWRREGHAGL